MKEKIIKSIRGDIVLTVSVCLAVFSCIVVPPNIGYLDYIDFRTLILLFCLMLIIGGLRELNFFQFIFQIIQKQRINDFMNIFNAGVVHTAGASCFWIQCTLKYRTKYSRTDF